MLSKTILMGRLTRDPELRHTQNGTAVVSFSLAIDRDRKGPAGERQTDFIDCVAWGKLAEFVNQWFTRGMLAIVVGRIQSRNWEDRNGSKRVSIEINAEEVLFGETKKRRENNDSESTYNRREPDEVPDGSFSDFSEFDDDGNVPF